jgi:histidine triad (HIT) family protein
LNILSNNGETAGQTVFHFHLHLIPRYEKDDVIFRLSNYMGGLVASDYKERANLIKEALL